MERMMEMKHIRCMQPLEVFRPFEDFARLHAFTTARQWFQPTGTTLGGTRLQR